MDVDALIVEIATNRARNTLHSQQRRGERTIAWDAIRASIVRGYEVVERALGGRKVLLLSHMPDKRPLHTVWVWDDTDDEPRLVTCYHPDEPAHKAEWKNGYRQRAR